MKQYLFIIIMSLIFGSCNDFEKKLYDKIDLAQKNAIEKNAPVIFDLNDITDFEWTKMLHIRGNESVPIHNFEIEPILNKQTTDLKTSKNRFYFLNTKNELIVKDINYHHNPSYNIKFCLKDSIKNSGYQWLTKDECKFTLIPNTKKTGTGMIFLFPVCDTKFDKDDFGIFHKQNIKLSIPKNVDSDFKLFLDFFNKDSIFQISRVKFPVKATEINYDDYETVEKVINLDNYKIIDLTNDPSSEVKEFDKYSQETIKEKTKATIEIRGIENGIHCDFEFKKIDGKWYLITWRNLST